MNRALFKLLMLTKWADVRRTLRGVKTVRGALLLLFTLGLIALMIGPQVVSAAMLSGRPEMRQVYGVVAPFAPPALFALTLLFIFTSAGEAAIYFTPAEVDLLFAAPFTRRELLLYKLAKTAMALVLMAAILSLTMLMNFRSWPAGFVGLVLSLGMMQLVGMATALCGQIVAESAYTRARKVLLLAVAVVVLAGLSDALRRAEGQDFGRILASLRESRIFWVLLAPFEVFTRTMFAETWFPDLVGWGAGALAIDVALLILVLKLDANYIESAATISQKVYDRMRRSKQGGGIAMPINARSGRLRLPPFPWLAGSGPIAWRQLLVAMRTSRHMMIMTVVIVGMGFAVFAFSPAAARGDGPAAALPGIGIGMVFYLTFIFTMQLPWAFRGDIDHIDFLKTLPLRPGVVAAGELAGGVLLLTGIQLVLFAALTAAAPTSGPLLLAAAAFSLPFNGILMAINNLLFLLYPVRMPAGGTYDFQMMGRVSLFMFLQFFLLLPLLGIPAALGGAVYLLSGYSWPASILAAWLVLAAESWPLVLAVAWAFQRFDVSTQTPA
jgi:ABC-2 type transport system permease protein